VSGEESLLSLSRISPPDWSYELKKKDRKKSGKPLKESASLQDLPDREERSKGKKIQSSRMGGGGGGECARGRRLGEWS